jgi:predicted ATPase/DNA-binding SARP family transcriptional activator
MARQAEPSEDEADDAGAARLSDVRIDLLGPLRVSVAGVEVQVHPPKERALLALLALNSGRSVRTEEIIDGLWEHDPPDSARKLVQNYVLGLRRILPAGAIETVAGCYRLALPPDSVDIATFERLLIVGRSAGLRGDHRESLDALRAAQAMWRGQPLADLGDGPAAVAHSTQLAEMLKAGEEDLVDARLALGEHPTIIGELEAAVAAEPLRERRWAQLMTALYRSGRQADALRAFQRLRAVLGEELGIEPGAELVALEQAIVLQRPELGWIPRPAPDGERASETASSSPVDRPILTNILQPPTPIIGREAELNMGMGLVREHRLVTLVGPGGAGKTRLAIEVALSAKEFMTDGVCWVALQTVTASELVMPAIAEALGARGDVAAHVGGRKILLILDNFEQVIDAAPVIAELLASTQELRTLVTSREPLRVAGEQILPIGPLPESDAIVLFVERALAENPSFTADESVGQICRRLDGLPLALELAAARVSLFSLQELFFRLERTLPILSSPRRDIPDRQRTLDATIRWSYDLLPELQQKVLRCLSPFDSFDLTAAMAVSGSSLDLLQSLLDKNLLYRSRDGRFRLFQTVREFGLARLEEKRESEAAHQTLLTYMGGVLEGASAELHGSHQPRGLARLDTEYDNLRAAAQWAVNYDIAAGARFAVRLGWYWLLRNRISEGLTFLRTVHEALESLPVRTRAAVLGSYGRLLYYRGEALHSLDDTTTARDLLLRAEEAWREATGEGMTDDLDLIERVASVVYLGIAAGSAGDRVLARRAGDEAIAIADASADAWCIGLAYWSLGTNLFLDRCDPVRPDEARELLEHSVGLLRHASDFWALGGPLLYLARQRLAAGDTEGAFITGGEALEAFQTSGEKWRTALAMRHLADVASIRGDDASAALLREQGRQLEQELGRLATVG